MLQSAMTSAKTSTHGETDVTNAHLQLNISTGDNSHPGLTEIDSGQGKNNNIEDKVSSYKKFHFSKFIRKQEYH